MMIVKMSTTTTSSSPVRSLLYVVMLLTSVTLTLGRQMCELCDCHISSVEDAQTVFNIALICNAGTITWFAAQGAVSLELTPFVHSHFRACFMAETINTEVKISREVTYHHTSSLSLSLSSPSPSALSISPRLNYKLSHVQSHVESPVPGVTESWLQPLLTSAGGKSKELCEAVGPDMPRLKLFLESSPSVSQQGVHKVKVHYDIRKLSVETPGDPMEECRPCSTEEILDSYCSADFVVLGQMTESKPDPARDRTDITVSAKQVIHQRSPQYFRRRKRLDRHLTGSVSVSSECGLRPGGEDMLMTGKLRLTALSFTCVTYLSEWRRIQHLVECDR